VLVDLDDERAARYSDLFGKNHDHPPECAYCPICATISVVRKTNPEVLEHLAGAARELIAAASKMIEEAERVVGSPSQEANPNASEGPAKIRRIDVG
jgi:Family of unknown function (DUF5304)